MTPFCVHCCILVVKSSFLPQLMMFLFRLFDFWNIVYRTGNFLSVSNINIDINILSHFPRLNWCNRWCNKERPQELKFESVVCFEILCNATPNIKKNHFAHIILPNISILFYNIMPTLVNVLLALYIKKNL